MSETAESDTMHVSVRLNRDMRGIMDQIHTATGIKSKSDVLRLGLMTLAEKWCVAYRADEKDRTDGVG